MTETTEETWGPEPSWREGFNLDELAASRHYWNVLPMLLHNRRGSTITAEQARAELEIRLAENMIDADPAYKWRSLFLRAALNDPRSPDYLAAKARMLP